MLNKEKTIESRFSKHKILPFQNIFLDDVVFVKKSSGPVLAYFTISNVLFFDLEKTSILEIRQKYQKELCVTDHFWKEKESSHYATLIFIDQINSLKPFSISKKGMQSWILLG